MHLTRRENWINTLSCSENRYGLGHFPCPPTGAGPALQKYSHQDQDEQVRAENTHDFDKKGGGSKMQNIFRQKIHAGHLSRLCRRATALTLALSMVLPTTAYGFNSLMQPTQMQENEAPTIIVEANAVINRWYDLALNDPTDYLTGELEVAIRVQSGKIGEDWQAFNTLGIALKYNSDILTPCRWTSKWEGDTTNGDREMSLTPAPAGDGFEEDVMTTMQTLKNNKTSTASAHVSETVGVTADESGDGYVYIRLDADRPVVLQDEKREGDMFQDERGTVLGVITFKYDLPEVDDAGNPVPGHVILAKDAEKWLSPTRKISDGAGGETNEANPDCLIQFATHEEVNDHYSTELLYDSEYNGMFYSTDKTVNRFISKKDDPNFNRLTLNETTYTEKEIIDHQINFVLTNKTTYNDGGLSLDDMATVLFYDWDDTLIGVLVVPKNGDARKLVNDYVRNNMIHPELQGNKNYDSVARTDNYRGKYPHTGPAEEDKTFANGAAGTVGDGEQYMLTNKLDYVFLKRPMVQDETDPNKWVEVPSTAVDGDGKDLYPYVHGWALIPDEKLEDNIYTHPKELWTTIGMGELRTYNYASSGGHISNDAVATPPAAGTPAELVTTDPNFKFANFNFGQKGNSLEAGSVYAVKAVYEPGEDLLDTGYDYRMIKSPYYNKLNSKQAEAGGAYSVGITYERSSALNGGVVQGVARMRDLVVRQDSTTDLLWDDPVIHDKEYPDYTLADSILSNATKTEADDTKKKSSFVAVEVNNGDVIEFSLTLSGRFNRIDYFLIDRYGSNYVSGQTRTSGNASMNGINDSNATSYTYGDYVVENYNYITDDSEGRDMYYDVLLYDEKEGSLGYILFSTLNNIMEKATARAKDPTNTEFVTYVSYQNMQDCNIRTSTGAKVASNNALSVRNTILAAAQEVLDHHVGDPDYWNAEKECAELTYHQLQLYIINPGRGILTREAADQESIKWCNLHASCANTRTGKPTSWETLIKAALDEARGVPEDDRTYKLSAFNGGTGLEEIEKLARLRADADGHAFSDFDGLTTKLVAAVDAFYSTHSDSVVPSWDWIQDHMIRGQGNEQYSKDNYWWYDGSTSVPLNSLAATVAAVQAALYPEKAPGETTAVRRLAKINQLRPAFDANDKSGSVVAEWNAATKNLCDSDNGDKFASFEDFRDKLIAAVEAADNAGIKLEFDSSDTADSVAAKIKAYWQKLQWHILGGSMANPDQDIMDGYWWYDGNSKIGDLTSLLATAQQVNAGSEIHKTIWNMLTLSDLENLTQFHFRSGFNGTTDLFTDIADFKKLVLDFVKLSGITIPDPGAPSDSQITTAWNQLQYYIIHSAEITAFTSAVRSACTTEANAYYWWRNGVTAGDPYPVTIGAGDGNINALVEAAYRYQKNGNVNAYKDLEDQLTSGNIEDFRFLSAMPDADAWDDITVKYSNTGIAALEGKLNALVDAAIAGGNAHVIATSRVSWLTWRQVQYYLLNDSYIDKDDNSLPSDDPEDKDGYWWRTGNQKPGTGAPEESDLDKYLKIMDGYIAGTVSRAELDTATELYSGITEGDGSRLNLRGGTAKKPVAISKVSGTQQQTFKDKIAAILDMLKDSGISTTVGTIDWYVLQYYAINANKVTAPLKDSAFAMNYYYNTLKGNWIPPKYDATATNSAIALMSMMASVDRAELEYPGTVVDKNEETGIITVTTTVDTDLENGWTLSVESVTVIDPVANTVVTTTTTTLYDEEGNVLSESRNTTVEPLPTESPVPTESPIPTESPVPTESESPAPTESPAPAESESPAPTESPDPAESESPAPTESPDPVESESPAPTVSPDPIESESPVPTESPEPTESESPVPAESPEPTESPEGGEEEPGSLETLPEVVTPSLSETPEEKNDPTTDNTDPPAQQPDGEEKNTDANDIESSGQTEDPEEGRSVAMAMTTDNRQNMARFSQQSWRGKSGLLPPVGQALTATAVTRTLTPKAIGGSPGWLLFPAANPDPGGLKLGQPLAPKIAAPPRRTLFEPTDRSTLTIGRTPA